MVLEAIGAFSLACNILHVLEYGTKVVRSARTLHGSSKGATIEVDDLENISQQLSKLNKDLSDSLASSLPLASPLQTRLTECNTESLRLSEKFVHFVQKLRPKRSTPEYNPTWTESFRSSVRLKWHQEEIEAMQKSLSHAKSNLIIAFLLHMHSTQASNVSQETLLTASNSSERNMLAAIGDTSDKLHNDITGLMQQMSNVKIDESTYETLVSKFQASHVDALSRLASGIETILLEQESIRITSNRKLADIAQQRICMSLSFRDMESRRNHIREAHENTYRWILKPQNTIDDGHSDFQGKPGSGKSTLMQYLDQNLGKSSCTQWLSGYDLFVARFYLWNPGRGFQKTFQGLLQAILYQTLSAHQWLIEAVVSEEAWTSACVMDSEICWSTLELKKVLKTSLFRLSTTKKVLLLIDGLDELQGTDDDRYDMLNFLLKLTKLERVKLCVSSRPWNMFSDFFHEFPQLQLQSFTRADIDKYVRHSLSYSMHLQSSYLHNSGEGEKLIETIVEKASGVFLWVRLVVQELLRGFRDGETIRTLRRKVDSMPADLDGFFRRIIDSIDPSYRREGSAFLQTALFSLQDQDVEWPRGLLEFTFLEAEDPDFITRPSYDFTELDLINLDAFQYRVDLGKRRLNSRCMGLLEWVRSSVIEKFTTIPTSEWSGQQLLHIDVDFLHRSLIDFLLTVDAQNTLLQCTGGAFDARRFLCSAMLTKIFAISARCCKRLENNEDQEDDLVWLLSEETDRLLKAIACSKDVGSASMRVIMTRLEPTFHFLCHTAKSSCWDVMGIPRIVKLLHKLKTSESASIGIAIEYNLTDYVAEHLRKNLMKDSQKLEILEYALYPKSLPDPNPEMVSHILKAGGNPNDAKPEYRSVWWNFLGKLAQEFAPKRASWGAKPISSANVQVIELMIKHNADKFCPRIVATDLFPFKDIGTDVVLSDILSELNFTDADLHRLKSLIRNADEITYIDPRNTESKLSKRKLTEAEEPRSGGRRKRIAE